ncbi:MAG: CidA/LrgA family protein [Bacilli bacterium]|nr:CidA/LrgA family protein [Bacilli bacterium]
MKYIKQFVYIITISFIGETLNDIIPLSIPASIYGIIILFLLLNFNIISLDAVEDTGKFLIEIMPIMFIPAAVGLIESWDIIKLSLIQYIILIVCTTIIVMVISGKVTEIFIKRGNHQ